MKGMNMEGLKLAIRMNNIPKWKIAEVVGVSEMTIYRWLRIYDQEHFDKINQAVKQIIGGESDEQDNENE